MSEGRTFALFSGRVINPILIFPSCPMHIFKIIIYYLFAKIITKKQTSYAKKYYLCTANTGY